MEGTSAEGLDAQLLLYMSRFRSVWDAPEEHEEPPQAALPASSRRADEAVRRLLDVSPPQPLGASSIEPPSRGGGDLSQEAMQPSTSFGPNESRPGTSDPGKPVSASAGVGDVNHGAIAVPERTEQADGALPSTRELPQGDIPEEPSRVQTEGQAAEAEARPAPGEDALEQPAPVSAPRGGPLVRRVTSSEEEEEGSSSPDSGSSADSLAKAKAAPKERPRQDSSEDASSTSSSGSIERS
eukprot:s1560_g2.t1